MNVKSICYGSDISLLAGLSNIDQHRNAKMNDKDRLGGQLTSVTCVYLKTCPSDLGLLWDLNLLFRIIILASSSESLTSL